jgi:uncharacterized protein YkwD
MMRGSILRTLALAAPLVGCMASVPRSTGGPVAGGGPVAAPSGNETAEVARLVNAHRARVGCQPLAWDDAAARAAQAHSEDMVRRRYFSHTSPDGRGPAERLRAQGATFRLLAENIAQGQPNAQEVVRGWLASPAHRQNIENCGLTRQGVGLSGGYWTHLFYTPLQ